MILIDGKKVSAEVRACLAKEAKELKEKTGRVPGLATVLVGDDAYLQPSCSTQKCPFR